MKLRPTSLVVVLLLCVVFGAASAAAQGQGNVTLSFAKNAAGAPLAPGLLLGDDFAPLGVHFNNSGVLESLPGGFGGGNNVVASTNIADGHTFDTLRITFDTDQLPVEMDISANYLGPADSVNVTLKWRGSVLGNMLTLTAGNMLPNSGCNGTGGGLCGRLQLWPIGAGSAHFDEIDISPTTVRGSDVSCQVTSGFSNDHPECGGVFINNLNFYTNAGPVPRATIRNSAGQATSAFCPGDTAVFDGSASTDFVGGGSLTYSWADVLDNPPLFSSTLTGATPSIVIPNSPGTYTAQLGVTDLFSLSGYTGVPVYVKSNNQAPVAQAASPSTVASGSPVMLDGTKTYDPDGDQISYYQWIQTGGPPVTLTNSTTSQSSFTSPQVTYPSTATLTFQLTATDQPSSTACGGALSSTANVNVTVEGLNHAPVANAGQAQTVTSGSNVTLNGSSSLDPDGDLITYSWTQTTGTPVTLLNPTAPMPTFIAPDEPVGGQETLTFQLVVTDQPAAGYTPLASSATVNITVQHLAPPDCSKAVASLATLWPPDHRMVGPVSVINVTDNAPGSVTIQTLSIYQDEPTSGLGSGDTSPDAVINNDGTFFLRSERAGTGDGRVYHINFTASNASGDSCSGVVTVCAPHDMGKGSVCVDQGPLYDSTH